MATIQTEPKVWLITGASQGLGLSLALAALRRGHKVLATARNTEKACSEYPDVEKHGGIWVQLDISKTDAQSRVDAAIREHGGGRIDVVVNNAGYDLVNTVEDITDEEMQLTLDTHVMGPFRIVKAVLPYMRAQKSGTLAFHSSCLAMRAYPSQFGYAAPKAAGEYMHEVLRMELRTFNIRTLIINSGLFHSNIITNGPQATKPMPEHYTGEGTIMSELLPYLFQAIKEPRSMMRGDPEKWGERVADVIDGTGEHGGPMAKATRLLLGPDSIMLADNQLERLRREIDQSRSIAESTDFDGTKAIGMAHILEVAP